MIYAVLFAAGRGDSVKSDSVFTAVLHGLDYLIADICVADLPHARVSRGAQGVVEIVVRLDARGEDDHVRLERLLCAVFDALDIEPAIGIAQHLIFIIESHALLLTVARLKRASIM